MSSAVFFVVYLTLPFRQFLAVIVLKNVLGLRIKRFENIAVPAECQSWAF
ncbi:MAG TPA: hypothetical protein VFV92_16580 [Candidatus Bathyarchaeia archaeon]|nr:hypothetical protein [Candidatus Bathyarchaeia archaeon]